MVNKHRKWAILLGAVLIIIAGTSLLCTEPPPLPIPEKHHGEMMPPKQPIEVVVTMEQERPEPPPPPPQFDKEDQIGDIIDIAKDAFKKFLERNERMPRKERMEQQRPEMPPPPPQFDKEDSVSDILDIIDIAKDIVKLIGKIHKSYQRKTMSPMDMNMDMDKDVIKFLEHFDPERLTHLGHLKQADPETFSRVMKESRNEMMKIKELKERDPQRLEQIMRERQMEKETKELSLQYRKSQNNDEKEKIKKEIKTRTEKLFDSREAQRENEIKRMEQELNKLKEKMKNRKANRNKIIEHHQKEILGEEVEEEGLGW